MPRSTRRRASAAAAVVALGGALLGNAPAATPTFRTATSGGTATPSQTLTLPRPSAATSGHVLVAAIAFRSSSTAISAPAGWTTVVQTACTTASSPLAQALFVRVVGSAEPSEYVFTGPSSTGAVGSVLAYSGVDLVQPVHASAGAITRNSKGLTASVATTASQRMLVGAFTHSGRVGITGPNGMSTRTDATTGTGAPSARMITADQLLATAGTHSRTAQAQDKNTCSVSQLAALNPAPDPPSNTALPQVSGSAVELQQLTATTGTWSGSPTAYAFAWHRCSPSGADCVPISGATVSGYTLTAADVGHSLRVVVTASNSGGSTSAASAPTPVVVAAAPPVNQTVPSISGSAREGQTLTSTTGTWSGSPTSYAYAWERCDGSGEPCVSIGGAVAPTYVVQVDDVGFAIRSLVTATNGAGSTSARSEATATVLPLPPSNTAAPVVSGEARPGGTLSATSGSWTGGPSSFAYQWERCDADGSACVTVPDSTAETFVLGSADVGRRIRVAVTATNAGGSTSAASQPTTPVLPLAPVSVVPPTISGTPRESEALTAAPGTWSGEPSAFTYVWERSVDDGLTWTEIASGTAYVPTGSDVGGRLRVTVTASNAGGSGNAASSATDVVAPALAPTSLTPPEISGTAQDGAVLTASTGTWTGLPTAFAYQWERCTLDGSTCEAIVGKDDTSYTPETADVGLRLRVVVSASNPGGTGIATSAPTAVVLRAAPVSTSPPVVSGQPLEGQDLVATAGEWSGDPASYAFLWHRCGADGNGCAAVTWADAATYRLREADVGLTIRVSVTATNEGGPTAAFSEPTSVVVPLPPVNESPPTISGVLEQGELVTAAPGTWRSAASPTFAYRWQAATSPDGEWTDIAEAESVTYRLTAAEVGSLIRVLVTATNGGGSTSASSTAAGPVSSPGSPINTAPPTYSGFVQPGRTLTALPGTWSGAPTSYSYEWQRSPDAGATWSPTGATTPTYAVSVLDVGLELRVQVSATNTFGSGIAASPSTTIKPAGNLVAVANQQWRCNTAVNLDLVKVTIWTRDADALVLGNNCTGRIARAEIDTWTADALKTVNSTTNAAHDLVIESGVAVCHDRVPNAHQDGWQSLGGARITVRNFVFTCGHMDDPFGEGVAQGVVISRAGAAATTPTDTVVEHSVVMPGAAHSVAVGESLRSGIRNSVVCPDRTGVVPFTNLGGAVDFLYQAIEEAPLTDPRCSSLAAALAWAQG